MRVVRRSLLVTVGVVALAALTAGSALAAAPSLSSSVVQRNLQYPWDLTFTPAGTMIVNERPGRIRVYSSGGTNAPLKYTYSIGSMYLSGESGLMGIALDNAFSTTRKFYVCVSRNTSAGPRNQVVAYNLATNYVVSFSHYVIQWGIVAARIHDGCAVEHGPDGKLWVTTGDADQKSLAQSTSSLNGKVLRVNTNGTVPSDNPVVGGRRGLIYSLGHRNPQGLDFQPGTNRPFAVEHGPDRDDEINWIRPGRNYGWPCIAGVSRHEWSDSMCAGKTFSSPAWRSGYPTIATSGAVFMNHTRWADWQGDLFVTTLKQSDLRRFEVTSTSTSSTAAHRQTYYDGTWGRLRGAAEGPSGLLYVTTSNGSNDKVVQISAN